MDDVKNVSTAMRELFSLIVQVTPEEMEKCGESLRPKQQNEEFLGVVVEPWTKAVYCLNRNLQLQLRHIQTDLEGNPFLSKQHRAELEKRAVELDQQTDVLSNIFWMCVRQELNSWISNIGVRKDWTVVNPQSQEVDGLDMLRRLFRGGR